MKIHFLIRTVFGEDACIDRFTDEAEYVEKLRETMRSFYETGDTDRCWDSAKIDGYTSDVAHPTEHMEAVFSVWVEECNHQAESWHYGTVEVPDPKRWFVTSDTDDGHTIITFHSEADMWKYIADLICRNLKPWNQLEELDEALAT